MTWERSLLVFFRRRTISQSCFLESFWPRGGHSTSFMREGSSPTYNHFWRNKMPLFYHTFIHITYYIPNNKAGDHASSNQLVDNLPFILKLNIYQKADFLLYELIWKTQYFLITYSVHTLNLTWFLKGLCHGSLVHFVYRWQVHILIRYETWEIDACERQNRAKSLLSVHQICLPSII